MMQAKDLEICRPNPLGEFPTDTAIHIQLIKNLNTARGCSVSPYEIVISLYGSSCSMNIEKCCRCGRRSRVGRHVRKLMNDIDKDIDKRSDSGFRFFFNFWNSATSSYSSFCILPKSVNRWFEVRSRREK